MNERRREWQCWRVLLIGAVIGVLTPVRVYPDSIGYLNSATSFLSNNFSENYVWLREPLYPLFLRLMIELPPGVSLHLIPALQGVALAAGLWLFAATVKGLGLLRRQELAVYYGLTCLLVSGYTGAILQQTFMVLAAASLAFCAYRLVTAPLSSRVLVMCGVAGVFAILLSSIFLVPVALLPFASSVVRRRRPTWRPFVAVWGAAVVAMGSWMAVRMANGQPFGLGGAAVLERSNVTDWPLRIQAFLATFGLAPDFYDGSNFNVLSYSNKAIGLNTYFGSSPCVQADLVDLRVMPDAYLMCGSTLMPSLPPSFLQPLTTLVLLQVVVGAIALVWAWSATSNVRLYAFVLVLTVIPCLPVAVFLADGNSRYGLPVLALSLILTFAAASRAYEHARRPNAADVDRPDSPLAAPVLRRP